jgi:hypothetical protein
MEPENNSEDKSEFGISSEPDQTLEPSPPHAMPVNQPSQPNKPGIIVLQWLTYAFWGWTIVALGTLLATTVSFLINGSGSTDFTPYGIAAVLVLLPISATCDFLYSKYEPTKKTGAASIVMVIHAVIFALLAIGSLIGVVFSFISLIISGADKSIYIAIITALSLVVVYGVTFLRTLHPAKLFWLNRAYLGFMILLSTIVIILAIIGPVNNERITKNDRLFTENASQLTNEIDAYSKRESALPETLSDLKSKDADINKLINSGLLTYEPNTKKRDALGEYQSSRSSSYNYSNEYSYFYDLCFNYKRASNSSLDSYNDILSDDDGYSSYINTYSHKAGNVCYKLETGY